MPNFFEDVYEFLRTKLNIRDSDETLIIIPGWPLSDKIKDGQD